MHIEQFVVEGLGNASHLIASPQTGVAAVIDAKRDVDDYLRAAERLGVRITHIFETHSHNDFISGSRELQAATGAAIYAAAKAGLQYPHDPVQEGDRIRVGDLLFTVMETPGHTPSHVSYLLAEAAEPDQPRALFSGGSLLVGAVARSDLLGPDHAPGLARSMFHTVRRLLALPDDVTVYPTHGTGSLCAAASGAARVTTIGRERAGNWAASVHDPDTFAERALANLPSIPAWYPRMAPVNVAGPPVLGTLPALRPLSPDELVRLQSEAGGLIVDTRTPEAFAAGHIPGSYHQPLRDSFLVWVGWLLPPDRPLAFVTEGPHQHGEIVRQLIRIGYERLAGALEGGMARWTAEGRPTARLPVLTVEQLQERRERGPSPYVLDVRMRSEWEEGAIPDAHFIELGSLPDRIDQIPRERPVALVCGSGNRSSIAASILLRAGFRDVYNVLGGMEAWRERRLPEVPAAV